MDGTGKDPSEKGLKVLKGVTIGLVILTVVMTVISFAFIGLGSEEDANGTLTGIGSTLCSLTMCFGFFLIPLLIIYAIVRATIQNKGSTTPQPGVPSRPSERTPWNAPTSTDPVRFDLVKRELEELKEKVERANKLETAGSHVRAAEIYKEAGLKGSAIMVNERMHRLRTLTAQREKRPIREKVAIKEEAAQKERKSPFEPERGPAVPPMPKEGPPGTGAIPDLRVIICPNCKAASEVEVVQGRPVVCPYCENNL